MLIWFIQWESLRKKKPLHYFPLTLISKCTKWNLRGTYLNFFFPGQHGLGTPRGSRLRGDYGNGYTGPKTVFFFKLTGLESLKLAFLQFHLKFNSAALWINQLQTHEEHLQFKGWDIFCYFVLHMVGAFVAFQHAIKTNPRLYPGVCGGPQGLLWLVHNKHLMTGLTGPSLVFFPRDPQCWGRGETFEGNIEVEGKQTHCIPRGKSLSVLLYLPTKKKKKKKTPKQWFAWRHCPLQHTLAALAKLSGCQNQPGLSKNHDNSLFLRS